MTDNIADNLVLIDGGTYKMGSPTTERQREDDELQHEVTISSFYISPYEVTQKDYENIMGINPSHFKGDTLPVDSVSWYEAIEYCNKLSEVKNLTPAYTIDGDNVSWDRNANGYRLLTEAEWEYAARATTTTPFNTETSISSDEANYYGRYPYLIEENYVNHTNKDVVIGEYRDTTVAVNYFKPNKWGLYNMHGNVSEWCFDYYGTYNLDDTIDPVGASNGTLRVNRGGGYNDYAKHLRSAYRSSTTPTEKSSNIGFRIARNYTTLNNENIVSSNNNKNIEIPSNAKVLVAYFSYSGNTENAAKIISNKIGADLFEIEMEHPYTGNIYDESQKDLNNYNKVSLKTHVSNMDEYDVILLGYPNWWATIPMPLVTFLEEYNFDNKIIIPFCSHGGGEFGESISDIAKLVPNAKIGSALSIHYSGGSSLRSDIDDWLDRNNINK